MGASGDGAFHLTKPLAVDRLIELARAAIR